MYRFFSPKLLLADRVAPRHQVVCVRLFLRFSTVHRWGGRRSVGELHAWNELDYIHHIGHTYMEDIPIDGGYLYRGTS